jgi:TonB family protein
MILCGAILSFTCMSPTSGAELLFKDDQSQYHQLIVPAIFRDDVTARLGDAPSGRRVCLATDTPLSNMSNMSNTSNTLTLLRPQQLMIEPDTPTAERQGSVFSTCDPLVQAPVPVTEERPQFTAEDMRAHVNGAVLLYGIVDENGQVTGLQIVRSLSAGLDEQSMKAFAQWKFRPALRQGKPVAVAVTGMFTFVTDSRKQR